MARARRKHPSQFVDDEPPPMGKSMLVVCPLCGRGPDDIPFPDDMAAHLKSHAPAEICQRCDGKERDWRLDWDNVKYPRPDVSVFYCSHCGKYAPVMTREEVSPSGEA
jgi:hypothetical protein